MRNGSLSEVIESLLGLVLFAMRWVAPSWSDARALAYANAASSFVGACSARTIVHDSMSASTLHLL